MGGKDQARLMTLSIGWWKFCFWTKIERYFFGNFVLFFGSFCEKTTSNIKFWYSGWRFLFIYFNDSPIYRTLFSYLTKGFENIPQKKISKMKKFGRYRKDSRSILWQKIFHFLLLIFLITFQISMNNFKNWMVNGCMHRPNLVVMSKTSITICTRTRPCGELWLVKGCIYMNS